MSPLRPAALLAATLLTASVAACSSGEADTDPAPSSPSAATTTTAAPSPEDDYLAALDATGLFPNVQTDARELWLRRGDEACRHLERTGKVVEARFAMTDALADWSPEGQGRGEPGLADKAVILVDAAQLHLCPDVVAH